MSVFDKPRVTGVFDGPKAESRGAPQFSPFGHGQRTPRRGAVGGTGPDQPQFVAHHALFPSPVSLRRGQMAWGGIALRHPFNHSETDDDGNGESPIDDPGCPPPDESLCQAYCESTIDCQTYGEGCCMVLGTCVNRRSEDGHCGQYDVECGPCFSTQPGPDVA